MCLLVTQSCATLCDPTDWSPPGSSVWGLLQARIQEWVALPFSRGSSWPRDQPGVSCIAGRSFTSWASWEAQYGSSVWRMLKGKVKMTSGVRSCMTFISVAVQRLGACVWDVIDWALPFYKYYCSVPEPVSYSFNVNSSLFLTLQFTVVVIQKPTH